MAESGEGQGKEASFEDIVAGIENTQSPEEKLAVKSEVLKADHTAARVAIDASMKVVADRFPGQEEWSAAVGLADANRKYGQLEERVRAAGALVGMGMSVEGLNLVLDKVEQLQKSSNPDHDESTLVDAEFANMVAEESPEDRMGMRVKSLKTQGANAKEAVHETVDHASRVFSGEEGREVIDGVIDASRNYAHITERIQFGNALATLGASPELLNDFFDRVVEARKKEEAPESDR